MNKNQRIPLAKRLKEAVKEFTQPERPLRSADQFSRLYEEKHLLVFRHIYGLCGGSATLAEDLTAETFTRAWQSRMSFTGDRQAAAGWLLRIGRNLVIDYQRRGIEQRTVGMTDEWEHPSTMGLPEEELVSAERQQVLMTLLQELSMEKREMITLRYLLDWRVKEIAAYLEMPENTVSVTIQRTLRQMRYRWPLMTGLKEQENVQV